MSGRHGGQTDVGIVANFGERFQGHVTTLQCPLVVLFKQQGANQAIDRSLVGKDADDVGAALDFAVQCRRRSKRDQAGYMVSFRPAPTVLELLVTREMPFGKYKGRLIADLPGHYLAWFAREGFPSGQLGQLLALMHELDHNNLAGLLEPLRKLRCQAQTMLPSAHRGPS